MSEDAPRPSLLMPSDFGQRFVDPFPWGFSGIDIGVAEYQLVRALPEPLDTSLPSIEAIEAALSADLGTVVDGEKP